MQGKGDPPWQVTSLAIIFIVLITFALYARFSLAVAAVGWAIVSLLAVRCTACYLRLRKGH
jgi:Na+-driven multidrug efflux pump